MTHPQTFLCEDLLIEIFSQLPIKSLLRFQCLSNSLKSLISNPIFVKLHLLNSRKNTNILLEFTRFFKETLNLVNYSLSSIVNDFRFDSRLKYMFEVVGSCNGLVCLVTQPSSKREKYLVCLWNPTTKSKSYKPSLLVHSHSYSCTTIFGFGYDSLSDTYKVVVAHFNISELVQGSIQSEVTIYNNRDNCWRNIQSFPGSSVLGETRGLYLNDTINWVATSISIVDYSWDYSFYIVSLHLGNETYKQLSLPSGFDRARPSLGILKDHLCASYNDTDTTHFILWQMNEYGVESSWTRLLKLSYARDTFKNDQLILVKMIDGKLKATTTVYGKEGKIEIPRKKLWNYTKDYVPSVVAP